MALVLKVESHGPSDAMKLRSLDLALMVSGCNDNDFPLVLRCVM